jgi:hypothetical protein
MIKRQSRVRSRVGGRWLVPLALLTGCDQDPETSDSLPVLDVTLVLSLGQPSSEPDAYFGSIVDIEVDSAGDLYVLDPMLVSVRRFGPTGEEGESFGRRGQGPGEFGGALKAVMLGKTGDIFVGSAEARSRLVRFSPAGEFRGEISFGGPRVHYLGWDGDGQGGIVAEVLPVGEDGGGLLYLLHRVDLESGTTTRIVDLPLSLERNGMENHVFGGAPLWTVDQDGRIAVGLSTSPHVLIHDAHGIVLDTVTIDRAPKRVTSRERESVFRMREESYSNAGLPPSQVADLMSRLHVEDTYPLFLSVFFGPGGTLWLELPATITEFEEGDTALEPSPLRGDGSGEWEVYDRTGELVATVAISGFSPHTYRGDLVYGVSEGPNGEPIVQVWKISGL